MVVASDLRLASMATQKDVELERATRDWSQSIRLAVHASSEDGPLRDRCPDCRHLTFLHVERSDELAGDPERGVCLYSDCLCVHDFGTWS